MKTLNCIILQSSKDTATMLEEYIAKVPFLNLVCRNVTELVTYSLIPKEPLDLVFWDSSPLEDSVTRIFHESDRQPLMVCTDPERYAATPNADMDIFSFMRRPFSFERFLACVTAAHKYLLSHQSYGPASSHDFLFIKSEYKIIRVRFDDILFCEGMKDYTQVYLKDRNMPIITLQNLKSFYSKLPSHDFIRVHRSYVVSLAGIDTIARSEIRIGSKIIPIGESFRDRFFSIVQYHS